MNKPKLSAYFEKLEFDPKLNDTWFAFIIDRSRLVILLILIIVLAGLGSVKTLPLESQPEVNIGMASIVTTYPGATPSMMEELVTKKIEKQIGKVKGIDKITSSSRQSVSVISVQFLSNADTNKTLGDLKDKVDEAKKDLPTDAKDPAVKEISMSDSPIWVLTIAGNYDGFELYNYGKKIQDELEKNPLVSAVNISGGDESEVEVSYDPQKLEAYGISQDAVNSLIKGYNISFPLGDQTIGTYKHNLTIDNRFYNIDTIQELPIGKVGTTGVVRLRDVAKVELTHVERTRLSSLSVKGSEPVSAVTLSVVKKSGGSIVTLVDQGNIALKKLKDTKVLPADLNFTTVTDQADQIRIDVEQLLHDGTLTVILVFLVLFLVIGLQEAFVAGIAAPLVFLMTFAVMAATGQTLNFLSMFALILSLGLLVDDAIVVISAISQYTKTGKFTTREAALLVLRDYKTVLFSTTLTVVWIFSSMMFMTGIMGKFIFSIPFVVTVTLLSSLLVALTINPALSVMLADIQPTLNKIPGIKYLQQGFVHFTFFENVYEKIIHWILERKWRGIAVVLGAIGLLVASLSLVASGAVKTEFFPKTDQNMFYVNMEAEPGTTLEQMEKNTVPVENILRKEKDIKNFAVEVGKLASTSSLSGGGGDATHYAAITVNLYKEKDGRKELSLDIAERVRKQVSQLQFMKATVVEVAGGPPSGADFEVKVSGDDFNVMNKIANELRGIVQTLPGAINVETSEKPVPLEFKFTFDKSKLQFYDISFSSLALYLKNTIDGNEVTSIFQGNDEIKVRTKLQEDATKTLDNIKHLTYVNAKGQKVFVGDLLASNDLTPSTQAIKRIDQKRIISVTATADKTTSGTQLLKDFQAKTKNYKIADGYELIIGGSNEESQKSVMSLFTAMQFGILLIVATLIVLFNSFKQTMLVLTTIPFSLTGVFIGLALFNQPLSFPGMIGMVALFGIVVRNGIILFDKINLNRSEGIPFEQAIADGGKSRLEPIVLTSICTIVGIIPITFTNAMWTPLGLALIFGLMFSTFSTLLTIPALYYLVVPRSQAVQKL